MKVKPKAGVRRVFLAHPPGSAGPYGNVPYMDWLWGCDARRAGQVWVGFGWVARGGPTGDTSARGGTAAVVPRARVPGDGLVAACARGAWCAPCPLSRCVAMRVSHPSAPPSVCKEGWCAFHARG